jgi:type I restriction-modification system DNA methylase subunit
MSKHYTCELCKKEFNQKIDFTRHQNKKAPCITLTEMQQISQTKEVKTEFKTNLSTIFNYCLDVLRNNEHLTGDKALRTLAHLLDLRLLEPQFGNQIDIDTYDYDFSSYEDEIIEKHKAKLLSMVRFSNLAKEKEENIPKIMKCLWDEILSVHPITKNIFLKGKGFDIQHQSTYKKLIDKLYTFDFEAVDEDILGEAYEEVIKDVMTGKVLGQFFTPPKVKQMMIKLIDPQLKADGTIEKIFDPAMGTGGFLISSLRHLLQQSKTKGIKMNWDFISNEGLGGREAEPDTYQLAISNMLISSGHMFNVLEKGDSIRNPITNKYDIILANPPFGIDGLTYNEILHPLRNEYMPIKSNSAVPLFLQAIIHMLKVNGRCAVVLPNGKELFSKGNELVAVREYLMKTCDLKEIYYLPPVFTHTTISTCVFNFIKKKECCDALETKIKISKTQKETAREYNFTKTHQTNKVKFYNYNPENEMKHLLIEVPIEKISKNGYSLNYAEYLDDTTETNYEDNIVVKTLEEICSIDYGTRIVRGNNTEGEYPVFGSGRQMFSTETFNREGFNVLIGRFALSLECVRIVNQKLFLNDSGLSVKPKTDNVLHKYIAYYLLENQNIIYDCARGTAQKNLDMNKFKNLKIPIPSIEQQKEIIKQIDDLNDENKKLEEQIKQNIKKSKQIISGMVVKSIIDNEPIDEVQNEIVSVEEEVIIEPKPKVKKIVKKVKKPLVIVEEDNEV